MVPPRSDRISRVPPYSRTRWLSTRTGLSPAMARLSRRFRFLPNSHWPSPRSLATTNGVSVDVLSSGYLDVSVHRVCFLNLCIQFRMTHTGRVSPFGNLRIKGCSHLPTAYRSVLRPSSPLSAKAFTKCPSYTWDLIIRRDKFKREKLETSYIPYLTHSIHTKTLTQLNKIELNLRLIRCNINWPIHNDKEHPN